MRIFSPATGAGLCDTIDRYVYIFKRLRGVMAGRFYRFEHFEQSSDKVTHPSDVPPNATEDLCKSGDMVRPL